MPNLSQRKFLVDLVVICDNNDSKCEEIYNAQISVSHHSNYLYSIRVWLNNSSN